MPRIFQHPILGPDRRGKVKLTFDGREIEAREGDSVAAALMANGVAAFRLSKRLGLPRGVFCGIGQCSDCAMIVDGVPNVKTCVTQVREGMVVATQRGLAAPESADAP